ncbi:hypothetical protein PR202_gb02160 [Eleusine coracana subsp. coracana]|uniref:Timeless N-terminal domain-containing protein n=1 Tax=Eleusine coracana subsp. coracana TaxID=191504 RepID=A0AAV5DX22_ELECO|nr:hypothetical protein PR202_gb02160 [Eleusine coracana subsp. coracana]
MDSTVLSLTCAGLGAPQEDDDGAVIGYVKGEHCLDNLKDLQRFLRRDDPQKREVFKQVCKWKIASRDLVPIIENYQTDRNLVITAVKVLVFLTMPVEPSSEDVALQIEYLWDVKAALTRSVAVAVIVSLLEDPLDRLERTSFTEDDWKLVQLVLTLFRNVLAIQEITLPQKASGEATHLVFLADSFLELMFQENVMDLILVLTQHIDEPSGYLEEENLLLMEIFHYLFLGRDPGLIARVSGKGSKDGSKSLCKGNPSSTSASSLRKIRNIQRGPQKRIAWDNDLLYIPKEGITEMLRNFMDQFLSGGYNIRDNIKNEHHSVQNSDITTFFKVARFVLDFQHEKSSNDQKSNKGMQPAEVSPSNRHGENLPFHGDICGPVAATLNEDMFNLVILRWRETYDALKETNDYKTLSAAGSLMKCMVAKRTRKGRRKKTSNGKTENPEPRTENVEPSYVDPTEGTKLPPESLPDLGSEEPAVEASLSEQGKVDESGADVPNTLEEAAINRDNTESLPDLGPEEPAVEASLSEQRKADESGANVPNTLEETAINRDSTAHPEGDKPCADDGEMKRNLIEEDEMSDSSIDDHHPATSEVNFDVSRLISSLANNSVVQNICWLLKHYKSNSFRTNHYIVCMLRRFCEDLQLSPMLYQLSLLTGFYDILAEQKLSGSKEYANIVNFLSKVVRKMLRAMKKQPLLFVDILFWKTQKECHCVDMDALLNELKKDAGNNGGIGSSKGWRGPINIADSLGDDEVDFIIPQAPYDANKDGDSSDGDHEGDFQKSTAYKRSRLMSLSDSEADDNYRYKDDRKCSHLIAEALDPSGKISAAQVSRKLTQLGLRSVMRRRKVADESLPIGVATEPQNKLDDMDLIAGAHNHGPKSASSRSRRKRLHGLSSGHDDTTHGGLSDEETLQVIRSRTKGKKLPLDDNPLSESQHQESQQDPESDDMTLGSMIRSGKKKRRSKSDFEVNVQNHQEPSTNTHIKDSSPNISQHQETFQGTHPDDESIGSILRNGKKKRLVMSNFSANTQENDPSVETVASKIMDAPLHHGLDPVTNSGDAGEAELLDDIIELEVGNHAQNGQRIIDDGNMAESGDIINSDDGRAVLKRRHRLVIDDDDDE